MNVLPAIEPASSQASFTIRTMSRAELDLAINWAGREGWNPGLHDADAFYAADPRGFFVGVLGDRAIGCISAVAYDATFGFIGFYMVRPEYRGQGFGLQIWRAGMAYLGERLVGLDGPVEQLENLEEAGLKLAYRTLRYEGTGGGQRPDGVIDLADVPFDEVLAYDSALFPVPRPRFLRHWLKTPGSIGYAAVAAGRLAGFGLMRPCRIGYKIGPLLADTPEVADRLYRALASCAPAVTIFLDTPQPNDAALALACRHDMKPVFETVRMYTGPAPGLALERIFGVTTLELG